MESDSRVQADDERALRWLRHRLEWEGILDALRDAGRDRTEESVRPAQEPAAA